jgi:hypothetical protein
MKEQIDQHVKIFKSWTEVNKSEAKGRQILSCQWVYVYKTDKHRKITKCKARIVVCGNQQRECDLQTGATTRLAGPDRGTGTGPDRTDFSAVQSQSKRPDCETVSIFGPDQTETFVAQAFINKLDSKLNR